MPSTLESYRTSPDSLLKKLQAAAPKERVALLQIATYDYPHLDAVLLRNTTMAEEVQRCLHRGTVRREVFNMVLDLSMWPRKKSLERASHIAFVVVPTTLIATAVWLLVTIEVPPLGVGPVNVSALPAIWLLCLFVWLMCWVPVHDFAIEQALGKRRRAADVLFEEGGIEKAHDLDDIIEDTRQSDVAAFERCLKYTLVRHRRCFDPKTRVWHVVEERYRRSRVREK